MRIVRAAEAMESTGAIPELADVIGSEILDEVKQRAQRVWVRVYGLELIRRELPLAYAKWETDDQRSERGSLPLFLNSWFSNRQQQAPPPATKAPPPRIAPKGLRDSHRPCQASQLPNICAVHRTGEICQIEGRG